MELANITKSLAGSNAMTRSKGLKQVLDYVSCTDLSRIGALKLWKGLFYCNYYLGMWMADQDQDDVADAIVALNSYVINKWDWVSCYFETMRNEWDTLDSIRIDKFMRLVRMFLRNVLATVSQANHEWKEILTTLIDKCKTKGMGLLYHISDIYVDEIPQTGFLEIMDLSSPFIELMKHSKLNQVIDMVYNRILLKVTEKYGLEIRDWAYFEATSQ
jgi:Nucleolar protein,Nop52